ncbi:CoA-binding protein [Candidatus Enterococcus ferrettii]|uniref:CoA-binding domain-containing protein n=1 Tax=Candidatus Enterococcus ferrettii TaxID=2815324 RepID=A0ABV0ENW2_9ENTE|nr:CoA-binding protein [Enterococcus sp. 665A]MBO1342849.1 CoA-binding protein [Enterococcus sp. 665A]
MQFENPSQEKIFEYLDTAKVIAVVGFSENPEKTSHQIAQLLKDADYTVYGVNPKLGGQKIAGIEVFSGLTEVPEAIDIVDIFRRSEFLPQVAKEFLQTDAKVFWAQLGLSSQEAAEMLQEKGRTDIVMDRCIKIELAKRV